MEQQSHENLAKPPASKTSDRWELAELIAVVLVVAAYPIVYVSLSQPFAAITVGSLVAGDVRAVGMTLLITGLLRGDKDVPWPLYKPARGWPLELVTAALLTVLGFGVSEHLRALTRAWASPHAADVWQAALQNHTIAVVNHFGTPLRATYEEVVFRAYLIPRIARHLRVSAAVSVVISALLFALMHGYPVAETVIVFGAGLVYGAAYVNTRSLPAVVLAHWAHNFMVFIGM